MKRCLAALLAAMIVSGPPAMALADSPFESVPIPVRPRQPHLAAYACFAAGAGLIAGSFTVAHRADREYGRYLAAETPEDIRARFAETGRLDRWSSGMLLGGEALVAAGITLRFLHRPSARPVAFVVEPGACAVRWRF
jgi:hypothetical protein